MVRDSKIKSKYYQKKVLRPIFTKEIPFLHPNDFHRVKPHYDKATKTYFEKYHCNP